MATGRDVQVAGDELTAEERRAAEETTGKKTPKKKPWAGRKARGTTKADPRNRPMTTHASRVKDERTPEHELEDEPWVEPATLPRVPKRRGMVQRWIRVGLQGKADPINWARKQREGWRPRKADTVPENVPVPTISGGKFDGCIGVEGMILCEMSIERNARRNAHYKNKNTRQTASINEDLVKANRHASTAFGPIRKVEESKHVRERREVPVADD